MFAYLHTVGTAKITSLQRSVLPTGKSSLLLGQMHMHEGTQKKNAMEPDTFFLERNFQKMGSTLYGGGGGDT